MYCIVQKKVSSISVHPFFCKSAHKYVFKFYGQTEINRPIGSVWISLVYEDMSKVYYPKQLTV